MEIFKRLEGSRSPVIVLILIYLLNLIKESSSSHVDEPCTLWENSKYFRGICWKFIQKTVDNNCQTNHSDAQQGVPTDQTSIRFLETLLDSADDTVIWSVTTNSTETSIGLIDVYDSPTIFPKANCTGLDLATGLTQDISCNHNPRVSCFLDVGNPCSSSDGFGDLYGSFCYFLSSEKTSWESAMMNCDLNGGYLAESIDNDMEAFLVGVLSLVNVSTPVLLGAQRNVSIANSVYAWLQAGIALDGTVSPGNESCVSAMSDGITLTYLDVPCDLGNYVYMCQDVAPMYEYFVVIPAVMQKPDTQNTAFITFMTSSQIVHVIVDVYTDGSLINSTSFLLHRHAPYKHPLLNIDDLLLTDIDIYSKAIHVTTYGNVDISLIYTSSSDNGNDLTSADVTIFPSALLETYYVITNVRMYPNVENASTSTAFISVLAIDEGDKTMVDVYFPKRYQHDIIIDYNGIDIINMAEVHFEINRFQSVFIESENDLTSTTVISNRPVAVYSGNRKTFLAQVCCPNYVMTNTIPHRHISNEYLVVIPSGVYSSDVLIRMTSTGYMDTVVQYDEDALTETESFLLQRVGTTRDIPLPSGTFHRFRSDFPFHLSTSGSYGASAPDNSQPCLLPIPPIHLYRYYYIFNPHVLLDSWTDLWLSIIGININITDSNSLSVNSISIQDYIDTGIGIRQIEVYGENNNYSKSIVLEIVARDIELVFESINRASPFTVVLNWQAGDLSFCRVLGIDIGSDPNMYSNVSATFDFTNYTSVYQSAILFDNQQIFYGGGSGGGSSSSSSSGSSGSSTPSSNNSSSSISTEPDTTTQPTDTTQIIVGSNNSTINATTTTFTAATTTTTTTPSSACLAVPLSHNLTDGEIQNLIKDIQKKLFVDPKEVSSYTRKFISASDPRPSSTTMGVFGIMIFSIMVVSLLIPDTITFTLFVIKWAKIFKLKYYG